MFMVHRALPVAALAAALLGSGCASAYPSYRQPGRVAQGDDRAYAQGYQDGRSHGAEDARRRRAFDPARHSDYRQADDGFRGYGDRNRYRTIYRQAFVSGYEEGYGRYGSAASGYPPQGRRGSGFPSQFPPAGVPGRYGSPAAEQGYRDGYDAGRDDARDRDRYDPVRAPRYRSGDRGYDRRYGSLDAYKRDYRAAFQSGYDIGYRENRR